MSLSFLWFLHLSPCRNLHFTLSYKFRCFKLGLSFPCIISFQNAFIENLACTKNSANCKEYKDDSTWVLIRSEVPVWDIRSFIQWVAQYIVSTDWVISALRGARNTPRQKLMGIAFWWKEVENQPMEKGIFRKTQRNRRRKPKAFSF